MLIRIHPLAPVKRRNPRTGSPPPIVNGQRMCIMAPVVPILRAVIRFQNSLGLNIVRLRTPLREVRDLATDIKMASNPPKTNNENSEAQPRENSRPPSDRPSRSSPPNHVFVGKKPVMSYAMSAMVQLAQSGEIVLKARGMVISRAVDVAEIVTKRLGNNTFEVKNIRIDTERLGDGEEQRNVSTIEIVVAKRAT